MRTAAVIPAFNEADRIGFVVAELIGKVDAILVVDDGSTDGTAEAAEAAGAIVVYHPTNQGYMAALRTGFASADADILLTIDADGEMPLENIDALMAPIRQGLADMVQGHRQKIVRPSERLLTWLASLKGPVGDSGTGMRAIRTDLARQLELKGECICGVMALEVLAKGGRIQEVPISLRSVAKPRGVAWYHLKQIFHLLPWMFDLRIKRVADDK
ncbi:glycosyltransferase family 2 protein [Pseudomonas jilinensis]|uniref:Glycosyltransferase family 2 protein n=1 Tax=Pseudomonas jilinensis TaxID=2078689 RepID=A0A396S9T8_9PSED|nr:glycosyltransferase family 2 protein [Pseudomonas jilinensis]RHW20215.1 glycosyltransferase family 2 protein [Pseudomonas jilinensis]